MSSSSSSVVVERLGACVVSITLNRPKKLNALDPIMIGELTAAVEAVRRGIVVMRGEGKAFCAGGDVAGVRAANLKNNAPDEGMSFFRNEYSLNALLGRLGQPSSPVKQVSLWDGIVMGGGAGLSVHGRFRVATERSVFAMPETAIGFFPDVGASYVLSRMPKRTGFYAALTGARLRPADLVYSGLATHYVQRDRLDALIDDLKLCEEGEEEDNTKLDAAVQGVLDAASSPPPDASGLEQHADAIDLCFSQPTVDAILARLRSSSSSSSSVFEAETAETLAAMSPTSLAITLESLRRAEHATLDEVLATDLRLAARLVDPTITPLPDFFEGVRAVLVDKDRNPQWHAPDARFPSVK
ncbi:hypothetical protein CTAYLR_005603 [Chrysophaeum taylorii]|uniref:3-hydroxyisobutyryl-CoA hydrolase n=1 Tax=Chrysophaeum taylorii TaxID=2483200 RepID=A0AAD7XKW9_9STRA|nr:hypothetical protein CTAYLR_005603 [Chrysophaeum taylorii]